MAEAASDVYRVGDGMVSFYALVERADPTLVDAGVALALRPADLSAGEQSHGPSGTRAPLSSPAPTSTFSAWPSDCDRKPAPPSAYTHATNPPDRPVRPWADAEPEADPGRSLLDTRRAASAHVPGPVGAFRTPAITSAGQLDDGMTLDVPGRPRVVSVPRS